jgi:hypothetical protein
LTKKSAAGPGELRKFGLLFAGVGVILTGVFWWKGSDVWWIPAACAVVFAGAGIIAPTILRPLHTPWMAFARFLGWLNTRILHTFIW